MNFSGLQLSVDRPFRVELNGPNGLPLADREGKRAYVEVVSTESKVAQLILRSQREAMATRRMAGTKITAEMIEADGIELLAHLTMGWYLLTPAGDPVLDDESNPLAFSLEAARQLYALGGSVEWLTEQVRIASAMRSNFMPALSKA